MILPALALFAASLHAAELPRACVKWSRDIPEAKAAGASLFSSVERVEGPGPFHSCDVVVETESFGVGWLMRAYMKQAVFSPCGKRLGGYGFSYKGDSWQEKIVTDLARFLEKNPAALAAAKECPPPPAPAPEPAPVAAQVEVSTAAPVAPIDVSTPTLQVP